MTNQTPAQLAAELRRLSELIIADSNDLDAIYQYSKLVAECMAALPDLVEAAWKISIHGCEIEDCWHIKDVREALAAMCAAGRNKMSNRELDLSKGKMVARDPATGDYILPGSVEQNIRALGETLADILAAAGREEFMRGRRVAFGEVAVSIPCDAATLYKGELWYEAHKQAIATARREERERCRQAALEPIPEREEREPDDAHTLGLRRRIHQLEKHNQFFDRCESAWCHPSPDHNPALDSWIPEREEENA